MPRISRTVLNGKFFHVIVQGINKEYIFQDDKNKEKYKQLLIRGTKENEIKIVAYCIMDNHAHILIYLRNIENLSKCMQKINTIYAMYYNKKNNRVGVVYRNRFYTKPINDLGHLYLCMAYIHKNPVKAGIVEDPSNYKYSSYSDYISGNEGIITNDTSKLIFSNNTNYKEIFLKIHKTNIDANEFELEDENDYNEIINRYRQQKLSNEEIIINLYKIYNLSSRKIAELLEVTRYKVRKIIK